MRAVVNHVRLADMSEKEAAALGRIEHIIGQAAASFYDIGAGLKEINDKRLYRATHKTFEAYCLDRWEFGDDRARQYIQAADRVDFLKKTRQFVGFLPANEHQARMLAKLTDEDCKEVWKRACEEANGKRIKTDALSIIITEITGTKAVSVDSMEELTEKTLAAIKEEEDKVHAIAGREEQLERDEPAEPRAPRVPDNAKDALEQLKSRLNQLLKLVDRADIDRDWWAKWLRQGLRKISEEE